MNATKNLFLLPAIVFLLIASCKQGKEIKYADQVKDLKDLKSLALNPEKGLSSSMWSSYDRRSNYDTETGKYIDWHANNDGSGYIRKEGENLVIAEMEGPGSIVRIWSAMPEQGHVKIYIDGSDEPIIDLPFIKYFDRSVSPFDYDQLVYEAARGQNNYVPIPYQESCKVVAEPGWGRYYQINYITYPSATSVESFSMDLDDTEKAALKQVNDYFSDEMGQSPYQDEAGDTAIIKTLTIKAGKTVTLADIKGQYAIKHFKVRPLFEDNQEEAVALRKLVLQMNWDNSKTPAVWSPLGDFFGTTPGENLYTSLPVGMTEDAYYSYWYMPFASRALVKLENRSDQDITLNYEIGYTPLDKKIKKYNRFHAKWHGDVFLPEDTLRWPDWTVVKTQGSGRYVGVMLHIMNPDGPYCKQFAGEGHAWWGEGDEKFFVDGEKFPSTYGTGTEDYFGYAWGDPALFDKAFHTQTYTSGNKGHQTVSRYHILDNVPFQKSFEGYIEKYYPNKCGTKYNCVVYWYLSPDGTDPHKPQTVTVDKMAIPPMIEPGKDKFFQGKNTSVEITNTDAIYANGGEIYYTTDGAEPTVNTVKYTDPITISSTTALKAKAFYKIGESRTVKGTYKLAKPKPATGLALSDVKPGLAYTYYEINKPMSVLPDFSKLDPAKSGIIEKVKLGKQEKEDYWAMQYDGFIRIPKQGMYSFYLNSDDGSKLFIGDRLIVNNDKCHGATEVKGKAALKAGLHPLKIIFFENELHQVLKFKYEGVGIGKQEVPGDVLFHK